MTSFPAPLCTPDRIGALCGAAAREVAIEVVAETGSSNADLLARIGTLAPRHLLLALHQNAGRGRAGRSWLSSAETSLTFSLAWKFRRSLHELAGLPLAVGVTIAETMAKFKLDVRLKWPNDILRHEQKLAGVLIESSADADKRGVWAIIGVGLNVLPPAAETAWPMAHMDGTPVERNLLMARLLDGLAESMNLFEEQGFAAFQGRWNALHAHAGKAVRIVDHGKILHEGFAVGVDASGRLLLDSAAGQIAIVAGDVSLRPIMEA
jgi:BirA family biotin operon repressor/biotin-[acetyl-CoA-carboxylase] ligase